MRGVPRRVREHCRYGPIGREQEAGPATESVRLVSSSPRAPGRVGGVRTLGRSLKAGPVRPPYLIRHDRRRAWPINPANLEPRVQPSHTSPPTRSVLVFANRVQAVRMESHARHRETRPRAADCRLRPVASCASQIAVPNLSGSSVRARFSMCLRREGQGGGECDDRTDGSRAQRGREVRRAGVDGVAEAMKWRPRPVE